MHGRILFVATYMVLAVTAAPVAVDKTSVLALKSRDPLVNSHFVPERS